MQNRCAVVAYVCTSRIGREVVIQHDENAPDPHVTEVARSSVALKVAQWSGSSPVSVKGSFVASGVYQENDCLSHGITSSFAGSYVRPVPHGPTIESAHITMPPDPGYSRTPETRLMRLRRYRWSIPHRFLVLLGHKRTFWCKLVLWDHASPRQAHKRDASRHI